MGEWVGTNYSNGRGERSGAAGNPLIGILIPRLYRGRVLVTMNGARPPLRSVRSA